MYAGGIQWRRHPHDYIRSEQLRPVIGTDSNLILDFGLANFVYDRMNSKGKVDVLRSPVPHQLEFAVRGNK